MPVPDDPMHGPQTHGPQMHEPWVHGPWMPAARLLRPQGRRGELLADPLTDLPNVFTAGRTFALGTALQEGADSPSATVVLEGCWHPTGRNAGRLVLKLAGCDSISAAEALEGRHLLLPEADLPTLDPDTFLVRDLLGCSLYNGDHLLGTITDLQFPIAPDGRTRLHDAADLLVLQQAHAPADAEPVLIPFVKAWLSSIDIVHKSIRMHVPPGLFDDSSPDQPA